MSLREGLDGFRLGKDLRLAGARLTALSGPALPWVEGAAFLRPDLECPAGRICNESGWLVRAGLTAPLSSRPDRLGPRPELVAGIGAAFSQETSFSYLLGFGVAWPGMVPRLSPVAGLRWERVVGLNLAVFDLGFRVDL